MGLTDAQRTKRNGTFRWAALIIPFVAALLVAFSRHESAINVLQARAEVIEQSIFRELQQINHRLDRLDVR